MPTDIKGAFEQCVPPYIDIMPFYYHARIFIGRAGFGWWINMKLSDGLHEISEFADGRKYTHDTRLWH
jgi:hypothetical protein